VTKKKQINVRVFEQKQRIVWAFHDDVWHSGLPSFWT